MQGQEADLVICCYAYFDADVVAAEAEFLLNRNRLNVSFSRAHLKTIVLTTDAVRFARGFLCSGAALDFT